MEEADALCPAAERREHIGANWTPCMPPHAGMGLDISCVGALWQSIRLKRARRGSGPYGDINEV